MLCHSNYLSLCVELVLLVLQDKRSGRSDDRDRLRGCFSNGVIGVWKMASSWRCRAINNGRVCKAPCAGYRLQWNRWIMLIRRGDKSCMVVLQLPFATSEAGGGGAPLS